MRRICTAAVLLVLVLALSAASAQSTNVHDLAALEAFFDGIFAVQLAGNKVPGAEVVVVSDGQILFSKGYGYADLENKVPMVPGITLHRPGSNSKLVIWTAVMQLVEQGKLDLYTDINTYLDFSIPSDTISRKDVPPITLHHLMTHTAGFEDEVAMVFVSRPELLKPFGQYLKEHLPARVFTPGSVMAYSNYGAGLAAYIVELVSGQPFAEYAQEHILTPLGMDSATFDQEFSPSLAQRLSKGYRYEAGRFVAGDMEYVQNYPAGGLIASSHDMARLIMSLLSLGELPPAAEPAEELEEGQEQEGESMARLLTEETARKMQTQQFAGHPQIPGMTYGLIESEYNGYRVLGHGGATLLFSTGLYFLPEENIGIYVVYNSPGQSELHSSLMAAFMDRYFPSEAAGQEPRPITQGTEANYTGVYHSSRSNFTGIESVLRVLQPLTVTVDAEGYLVLSAYGETRRFGEISPGLFQELNGAGKVAFSFQDGKAERIVMPGPSTWLRTPWQQSPGFLIPLTCAAVLFMLGTIVGWIKGLFRTRPRRSSFFLPKAVALVFILLFITIVVMWGELLAATHPAYDIPLLVLEPSSTLKAVLLLTKILMGLGTLMLVTAVYVIVAKKGTVWQRIHYALLTLSALSVNLILWQLNLW
jgi:CubicO group peptidase (beta-lactamase class C family)